ncbi:hypothetical protein WJX73_003769 [Symbiochloris irregularis]|uniref:F-box domain-containing protein n=1 Tax=Symbiochloris irregularis TaxID=706552 RepID=A0AAW1P8K6_9CHLO
MNTPTETETSPAQEEVIRNTDLLQEICKHLGPKDLQVCSRVSHAFRQAAVQNAIWEPLCEALWSDKKCVPARDRTELSARQRYRLSLLQAKDIEISSAELCSLTWLFRFKRSAGDYWVSMDPFWTREGPLCKRTFTENGEYTAVQPDPFTHDFAFRWRFAKTKQGKKGHYIKVNNFPSLVLSRTKNWGWRMENEWVVMAGPVHDSDDSKDCREALL